MFKLKMLVPTALAVAMVGVGALAAAPSASAAKTRHEVLCESIFNVVSHYGDNAEVLRASGLRGNMWLADWYDRQATNLYNSAKLMGC
jgi:hypothetical protein